ncbi:hypothetical protein [Campylobacter concisus]|uniref:hypothetical protein n=1 Tax=Campylobacter concisus TaxID=199 RepID=UPI000CD8ED49|nr:hypothetical protein [Campylobacter concisus]
MLCVKAKITFEISFLLLLNVVYLKVLTNFKIYKRAYYGSKFSSLLRRVSKVLKFINLQNSKFLF